MEEPEVEFAGFRCRICGKTFPTYEALMEHGRDVWKCPKCGVYLQGFYEKAHPPRCPKCGSEMDWKLA